MCLWRTYASICVHARTWPSHRIHGGLAVLRCISAYVRHADVSRGATRWYCRGVGQNYCNFLYWACVLFSFSPLGVLICSLFFSDFMCGILGWHVIRFLKHPAFSEKFTRESADLYLWKHRLSFLSGGNHFISGESPASVILSKRSILPLKIVEVVKPVNDKRSCEGWFRLVRHYSNLCRYEKEKQFPLFRLTNLCKCALLDLIDRALKFAVDLRFNFSWKRGVFVSQTVLADTALKSKCLWEFACFVFC